MIKSELVGRLAQRYPHLYHRDVERIVCTVFDEIAHALSDGRRVELRGYTNDSTTALGAVTEAAVRAAIQGAK